MRLPPQLCGRESMRMVEEVDGLDKVYNRKDLSRSSINKCDATR